MFSIKIVPIIGQMLLAALEAQCSEPPLLSVRDINEAVAIMPSQPSREENLQCLRTTVRHHLMMCCIQSPNIKLLIFCPHCHFCRLLSPTSNLPHPPLSQD